MYIYMCIYIHIIFKDFIIYIYYCYYCYFIVFYYIYIYILYIIYYILYIIFCISDFIVHRFIVFHRISSCHVSLGGQGERISAAWATESAWKILETSWNHMKSWSWGICLDCIWIVWPICIWIFGLFVPFCFIQNDLRFLDPLVTWLSPCFSHVFRVFSV